MSFRFLRSHTATVLSAEPDARMNSEKGLKLRQFTCCRKELKDLLKIGQNKQRKPHNHCENSHCFFNNYTKKIRLIKRARFFHKSTSTPTYLRRVGVHGVDGPVRGGPGVPDNELLVVGNRSKERLVHQVPGHVLHHRSVAHEDGLGIDHLWDLRKEF